MPIRTRRTRTTYRSLVLAASAALMAVSLAPAHAQPAPGTDRGDAERQESRPIHSYENAIRESVWVDIRLDGDGDGKNDRVAVDVVRPSEPAGRGQRIPVIMDASPYYACCGRGNETQRKTYDAAGRPVQIPLYYDNYFVPRGYAFAAVDLSGTNRSDGCVDIGGTHDIQSGKAVVDWLNGRARGYTSRTGTELASADWSTGDTAMIGKSFDGAIANGVAATGVEGLKTVVPIGALSSWYDYYFARGAPLFDSGPDWLAENIESASARARCQAVKKRLIEDAPRTGDDTPLWHERDYVRSAHQVTASVFAVHGMQDLNVRGKHFGQWWDALAAEGVERKVWLSQVGHVDPFDFRRAEWVKTLHRWFDHHLLGYDNGIDDEPMADIERAPDQWTTDRHWPPRSTKATAVRPAPGAQPGVGTLSLRPAGPGARETFTDDPTQHEIDWAAAVDRPTPAKVGFVSRPLSRPLRLSGSGTVTVTATPTTTSAHLSAVLVDLGPAVIRDYAAEGEGITTLPQRSCWGASTVGDSACFKETAAHTKAVEQTVFSRGWADLGHHADSGRELPLAPGKPHTITLDLHATDQVVPAGHRLALIVAGTDRHLIEPPATTGTLTLDLARTSARLPVVGGSAAFARATGGPVLTPAPSETLPDAVAGPRAVRPVPGGNSR
ncbi:Xaa-Pro dipeptidyl-peptidase [Streptomyces sp. NPDC005963]|uniref:Xaa-Pro dipeptidyl-peptidase n=1 Tax=Streptomyces sp. NPDC005963 TaxID=3156721 RepID=UPI003411B8E3